MEHVAIPISFPQLQVPQTDMVSPHCRTLPNVISYSTTLSNLAVGPNGVTDDESGVSTGTMAKTHWQRGIALCAGCQQERLRANEASLGFGGGGNQKKLQSVLQILMEKCGPKYTFGWFHGSFFGGHFPLLGPPPLTSKIQDWSSNPALLKPSQKYPDVACKASRPCYTTYTPVN